MIEFTSYNLYKLKEQKDANIPPKSCSSLTLELAPEIIFMPPHFPLFSEHRDDEADDMVPATSAFV